MERSSFDFFPDAGDSPMWFFQGLLFFLYLFQDVKYDGIMEMYEI